MIPRDRNIRNADITIVPPSQAYILLELQINHMHSKALSLIPRNFLKHQIMTFRLRYIEQFYNLTFNLNMLRILQFANFTFKLL